MAADSAAERHHERRNAEDERGQQKHTDHRKTRATMAES